MIFFIYHMYTETNVMRNYQIKDIKIINTLLRQFHIHGYPNPKSEITCKKI